MKKQIFIIAVLILASVSAWAQPKALLNFTLPDPDGGMHNSKTLAKNGMVLVVTAPTLHDKGAQEGWSTCLPGAMPKGGMLVFIEDMSVSAWKSVARNDMRKDWKPGVPPMLLLDESGGVRKELGVAADATVVLVYDKSGSLVYSYSGGPSAAAAATIWSKVK
jgi:hypothetical protein